MVSSAAKNAHGGEASVPARVPAYQIIPLALFGALAVVVIIVLAGSGTPHGQFVGVGVAVSLSFVSALSGVFYYRLRWSGRRSLVASVGWWILSIAWFELLLNPYTLWPMAVLFMAISVFLIAIYARSRWV